MKKKIIIIISIIIVLLVIVFVSFLIFNNLINNINFDITDKTIETSEEKCARLTVTLNGYSFVLGEENYKEFLKNTNFHTVDKHKRDYYGEYCSDGYSQIYIKTDENKKIIEIGIGNNLDNGRIHFDPNNTTFTIDNNDIKFGMSREEVKRLDMYSNEQFSYEYIYLYSNKCDRYNIASKNCSLIQAFLNSEDVIFGFWLGS